MQLDEYRILFVTIGLIGVLVFASPTLAVLVQAPSGQQYSEIYILGPSHTLDNIPFNVLSGTRYLIYLGVANELGHSSHYKVYAKVADSVEPVPNATDGTSSALPVLYEYDLFLKDKDDWQAPFAFQVDDLIVTKGTSLLSTINFNGVNYSLNKVTNWNSSRPGFYYNLFFELWIYNSISGNWEYNNRFVSLMLNMTSMN